MLDPQVLTDEASNTLDVRLLISGTALVFDPDRFIDERLHK